MRKGFVSLVLVVLFATAYFSLADFGREEDGAVMRAQLRLLGVEKDYYLRAGLRDAMKGALLYGATHPGEGEAREVSAVEKLAGLAAYAASRYAAEGVAVSFWCAQTGEDGIAGARKWGLSDAVSGYCADPLDRLAGRPDAANACSLMVSFDEERGEAGIARAKAVRTDGNGWVCTYPELVSSSPSVFGASVSYAGVGGEGYAVLPEGLSFGGGPDD
ncbi:MAG: hypothetical protein PHF51_03035 [Candidatus ainarchaeum sp.]|nr:hypothetical protein [Candidatus ainarchaeum sp.]